MELEEKQTRYEELYKQTEDDEASYTQEDLDERVRLFYELNPDEQHWRNGLPDVEPSEIWPEKKS